ncbi:MAG: phage holin family protein [Deltaproteobacteria bacterium]
MGNLIIGWILSALGIVIVSEVVPGFTVAGFVPALIAALVIGLVNGTIGFILKILAFPITIITFGLFLFVINALMLKFSSAFVSGFAVENFTAALLGALALAVVNSALRLLFK